MAKVPPGSGTMALSAGAGTLCIRPASETGLPARDELVDDDDVEHDHEDRPQREGGEDAELHDRMEHADADGQPARGAVAGEEADGDEGHHDADGDLDPAPGGEVPDDHASA